MVALAAETSFLVDSYLFMGDDQFGFQVREGQIRICHNMACFRLMNY